MAKVLNKYVFFYNQNFSETKIDGRYIEVLENLNKPCKRFF